MVAHLDDVITVLVNITTYRHVYTLHAGLSDVILLVNTTQSTITISWSGTGSITTTGYRFNYTGIMYVYMCVCVCVCVCVW